MSLKRNLIANYLGQGWVAVMGIAFVPLYIRALGLQAYGLVGVFSVLQASLALFDLGLTPTLIRETARLRGGAHTPQSIRDLLRSLELVYVVLAAFMVLLIWFGASWLGGNWLKADALDSRMVIDSIRLMAWVLAMRWVEQVYRGALVGLQDQVWLNVVQAMLATARWGGAVLVVTFWRPSVLAFFTWHGLVSCLTAAFLAWRTYRVLPVSPRPGRFRLSALSEVRVFASGMFLGAVLSFTLMQADKIIMSKLLPLDQLGYYMLAVTLSGGLLQLMAPMNNAIHPRLTVQVTTGDSLPLRQTYFQASELMAAIIVPPALVLVFFSRPVLLAWTGDAGLTHAVAPLLTLLGLGTLFNGLMNLPYLLQTAHGWTSLTVWKNIIATGFVVPALLWVIPRYGATGAASVWLALNLGYLLLEPMIVFRRILVESKWRWYRRAVIAPLGLGGLVAILFLLVLPPPDNRPSAILSVAMVLLAMYSALLWTLPGVRQVLRRALWADAH